MRANSHFQPGSGVYECESCGKKTRETGESESCVGLCLLCFTKSTEGNGLSDNAPPDFEGYRMQDESLTDDPWKYMEQASNVCEALKMSQMYREQFLKTGNRRDN